MHHTNDHLLIFMGTAYLRRAAIVGAKHSTSVGYLSLAEYGVQPEALLSIVQDSGLDNNDATQATSAEHCWSSEATTGASSLSRPPVEPILCTSFAETVLKQRWSKAPLLFHIAYLEPRIHSYT